MKRVWHEREVRLLHEYLAKRFPKNDVILNTRVGDIPEEIKVRYAGDPMTQETYRAGLPRADAIVFDGDVVWIIEAKLEAELAGAAQLTMYRSRLPSTPKLVDRVAGKQIKTLLVVGRESRNLEDLCRELGHEIVIFQPPWAAIYMAERGIKRLSFG